MSGSGRATGTRQGTRPMRRRPAAFQRTRAAGGKTRATIRRSRFPAGCSRAVRISARQTIAAAIGLPRAIRSRSIRRPAMSGFGALFGTRKKTAMNRNKFALWAAALGTSLFGVVAMASDCAQKAAPPTASPAVSPQDVEAIASDAYLYAYPFVSMATNVPECEHYQHACTGQSVCARARLSAG
jgi:hypothetical protein